MSIQKIVFAIFAAALATDPAHAFDPNKPEKPVCHMVKSCHIVGPWCNPNSPGQKKAPCPAGSTASHQVCAWKKVCE